MLIPASPLFSLSETRLSRGCSRDQTLRVRGGPGKPTVMESFFKGRDIWIVSSVCLVASFLWSRLWDLLSYRRKGRGSSSADAKKNTSTKATKETQDTSSAWEVSILESTPKSRLHGPKHLHSSRKYGDFLRDHKGKDGKEKSLLSIKDLKAQKKKKPPEVQDTISVKKQALLLEEVQKLNRENAERSGMLVVQACLDLEAGTVVDKPQESPVMPSAVDFILEVPKLAETEQDKTLEEEQKEEQEEADVAQEVKEAKGEEKMEEEIPVAAKEETREEKSEEAPDGELQVEEELAVDKVQEVAAPSESVPEPEEPARQASPQTDSGDGPAEPVASLSAEEVDEVNTSAKRRVTEEDQEAEDHKKSRVEERQEGEKAGQEGEKAKQGEEELRGFFKADGVEFEVNFNKQKPKVAEANDEEDTEEEQYFFDSSPPPPAPFGHRIVSAKPSQINNFYTINRQEVIGGGRFGQVHKCIENSSGLTLAAKIIKARSPKEKEVVKNEIQVMNQLDHANLIQLYAAYESRTDIILVLEYVDGGELFDRIIDENYTLTELDTVMFIRQICEGLRHMHKMYFLHLDLKPENILCVSRVTNKIKIIDFGLARKYNPREKLKVNFGTPEFLAPEVINYDFVSFNTDMWSLGVITYMLLSGLSPFLGDDDGETLNNILQCQWNFEEAEFIGISDEAKDFISKLLLVNKSWRIGAAQALKHPWLSDPALHHRLHEKKNMCRSRRNSCVPPPES
ncbi:myosin light chain kinase 2, skeletal/cardiac muscle isoform X4 [Alosa sapidissima]|uniref:myosin light chain kinase 2, skeletal/cardiac muscle isoform X4 n=1 Tax=Alosa sapidissima TaxID=34773 RepID=UPI001C097AAC|nr:myosin light chain kinase 2, skeletal/cardiac muscle isoform X4 [Alosa sapidissima]